MENQQTEKQTDLTVLSGKMEVELQTRKEASEKYKETLEQDLKEKQSYLNEKKSAQTELQKLNADTVYICEYESECENQIAKALTQMSQMSNSFIKQYNSSSKNITDCVTRISSLETLQVNLIQDITEIEEEKLQLGQQLKIKLDTKEKLTEQCDKNEQRMQFIRTEAVKKQNELEDKERDLQNYILESEKFKWKLSVQNSFCMQQCEQLLEENNQIDENTKLALDEAESKETHMKNQIENLKEIKLNNEQRVETLQSEITTRQEWLNVNNASLNDMKTIKDNVEKILMDFQEKCSALEDQVNTLTEQTLLARAQFEQQTNDMNAQISELENNCNNSENEIQDLEKIISDSEISVTETKQFNETQNTLITELQDKVKISNKILEDNQMKYENILNEIERNMEKEAQNNIEAKTIQQSLQNELNDLTTTDKAKKMRQKSTVEDKIEMNIKIEELKKQKESLKKETAKVQIELNNEKGMCKQQIKELKKRTQEETKDLLKNYNDQLEEKIEFFLRKTEQLKDEIKTLKSKLTNDKLQVDELNAAIPNTETHLSLLDVQIEQARTKKENIMKEIEHTPSFQTLSLVKATTTQPKFATPENLIDSRSTLADFSFCQPVSTSTPKEQGSKPIPKESLLDQMFDDLCKSKINLL